MSRNPDRLYELLPAIYRIRDAEKGYPLRALLKVISEQVSLVENDIAGLYENWFIETAEDWAVPYIGDLIGYKSVHNAYELETASAEQSAGRRRFLIPRREVANTIGFRQRRGTLSLLEDLANATAGWPARAVEFNKLLSRTQHLKHPDMKHHQMVNLRNREALHAIGRPFDESAYTIDVRSINSQRTRGRCHMSNIGIFVWRLKSCPVTGTEAYCMESMGDHCYTFSALGNDIPLYTRPVKEESPTDIAGRLNVPAPICPFAVEKNLPDYYGEGKSFRIMKGSSQIDRKDIVIANLSDWNFEPENNKIAVDPLLGRLVFSRNAKPAANEKVYVDYHYGFADDIGGGEYHRILSQFSESQTFRVGQNGQFQTIGDAIKQWELDKPCNAIIELTESSVFTEVINIAFQEPNQTLQIRAANWKRPVIRLLDYQVSHSDAMAVKGKENNRLILEGLLIAGQGIRMEGCFAGIAIRHCTLTPAGVCHAKSKSGTPHLELINTKAKVRIEHTITGSIRVSQDQVMTDPILIHISDSIVDAAGPDFHKPDCIALAGPGKEWAHAVLKIERTTVLGRILAHAIELAENSIFMGTVCVARSQVGGMRFCYVPLNSRTPKRFNCQPDMVVKNVKEKYSKAVWAEKCGDEELRVKPEFMSMHYGSPDYCRLAHTCAKEIRQGGDDASEMGVFHDLWLPQREKNLIERLNEYTPAGMKTGIIYVT